MQYHAQMRPHRDCHMHVSVCIRKDSFMLTRFGICVMKRIACSACMRLCCDHFVSVHRWPEVVMANLGIMFG